MPKKKRAKYNAGGLSTERHVNIAGMATALDARVGLAPETATPVWSVGVEGGGLHSEVYGGLGGPKQVTTSYQHSTGGTTTSEVDLDTNKYRLTHYRDIQSLGFGTKGAGLTLYGGTKEDYLGTVGFRLSMPFGK
jgi:hypothetical protein